MGIECYVIRVHETDQSMDISGHVELIAGDIRLVVNVEAIQQYCLNFHGCACKGGVAPGEHPPAARVPGKENPKVSIFSCHSKMICLSKREQLYGYYIVTS